MFVALILMSIQTIRDGELLLFGSAALDIAYVAAGRYDGYFQNDLNLWDIAAGIVLVIAVRLKGSDPFI